MKKLLYLLLMLPFAACQQASDNPFLREGVDPNLPVNFTEITSDQYMPAIKAGIEEQKAEFDAVANNPEAPTFDNTIGALEASGATLNRVMGVFFNLNETDADATMKATEKEALPLLTAHSAYLYMNPQIFARVKTLQDNKANLGLTREQEMALDKYYKGFVNGGALLGETEKARFQEIDTRLGLLQVQFSDNTLAETNAFSLQVTDQARLAGLPQDQLDAAAKRAQQKNLEGWVFNIQKPCLIPFLQYCADRELRKQMYLGYYTRGNNNDAYDNKAIIKEILELRLEKARLLGFETFADFSLSTRMAKTPQAAYDLLMTIYNAALPQAKREAAEMQAIIRAEGGDFALEPWDWWYYAEKLRKQKYNMDENEVKPYFTLENTRKGAFMVAERLFGVKFVPAPELSVYYPAVVPYECLDADGTHLAYFYTDNYVRETKRQGAWMNEIMGASNLNGKPVRPSILNVCNFSLPGEDGQAYLSVDDVRTLFHEFGHALHGMLTQVNYPIIAGTAVARDFVELPSQIMEHWAMEPEILKAYAFHNRTGEPIPDALIAKLQETGNFNTGFNTVELVAAALLDLEYHMKDSYEGFEDEAFEKSVSEKLGMMKEIDYRYRGTFFNHTFAGGYSAGYYSYLWAEVLDADAFEAFRENGILDKATGLKYRENILEMGGAEEPMTLYRRFRGQDPDPQALLKNRGLL